MPQGPGTYGMPAVGYSDAIHMEDFLRQLLGEQPIPAFGGTQVRANPRANPAPAMPFNSTPEGFEQERRGNLRGQMGQTGSVAPNMVYEPWMGEEAGYKNLTEARQPGARYNSGFGNVPETVREPRSVEDILAGSQRNDMLRGLTPSQRRLLDAAPQEGGSALSQALKEKKPSFQPNEGWFGDSTAFVEDGRATLVGPGVTKDRYAMSPLERRMSGAQGRVDNKNKMENKLSQRRAERAEERLAGARRAAELKAARDPMLAMGGPEGATAKAYAVARGYLKQTGDMDGARALYNSTYGEELAKEAANEKATAAEKASELQKELAKMQLGGTRDVTEMQIQAANARAELERKSQRKSAMRQNRSAKELAEIELTSREKQAGLDRANRLEAQRLQNEGFVGKDSREVRKEVIAAGITKPDGTLKKGSELREAFNDIGSTLSGIGEPPLAANEIPKAKDEPQVPGYGQFEIRKSPVLYESLKDVTDIGQARQILVDQGVTDADKVRAAFDMVRHNKLMKSKYEVPWYKGMFGVTN